MEAEDDQSNRAKLLPGVMAERPIWDSNASGMATRAPVKGHQSNRVNGNAAGHQLYLIRALPTSRLLSLCVRIFFFFFFIFGISRKFLAGCARSSRFRYPPFPHFFTVQFQSSFSCYSKLSNYNYYSTEKNQLK